MAKKLENKNDPIEWDIHYRRVWRPIPINKPNWKYTEEEKLPLRLSNVIFYLLSSLFFIVFSISIIIYLVSRLLSSKDDVMINIVLITMLIPVLFLGIKTLFIPIRQYTYYKNKSNKAEKPKIRKKKQPKHRKDYK